MTGSSDVSRSKHKVEVLYNIAVLLMPDKDLHAYLANDNLNILQSGLMTLILMIHRQYLDVGSHKEEIPQILLHLCLIVSYYQ